MLVLNPASASSVGYWQRSASHSAWLGHGAGPLGLSGPVDATELRAILLGREPGGGALTTHPGLRRRHGWDLVFAAPKSLSLLVATGRTDVGTRLRDAYRRAVTDAVGTLEDRAAWVRRSGHMVPVQGVVAAAFEHLDNDAGQPHLHSHVVLANLGRAADGGWSCLVGGELWRWREGLGAGFQLALRARLGEAGFGFRWALCPGGLGEIDTVPGAAIAAASVRSRTVQATARRFGSESAATGRIAQGRSRRASTSAGLTTAATGWDGPQTAAVVGAAQATAALAPPPPSATAVTEALARRGSVFNEPDVLVALAESCPAGLGLAEAAGWARRWCESSETGGPAPGAGRDAQGPTPGAGLGPRGPAPGAGRGRWTSARARQLDHRVIDLAVEARFAKTAAVSPAVAEGELAALGTGGRLARAAFQLACSGEGVAVLPAAPWLDQAACADAARAIWQAAGMTVEVACPSELSARRWRALTSLEAPGGARSVASPRAGRPGHRVLVVDAADHMSPVALAQLVEQATDRQTKLVLVVGGTVPGRGPSMARSLDQLADQPAGSPLADLAGAASWAGAATAAISLPGISVQGSLTGTAAMAHLVAAWDAASQPGRLCPLMVAFGPAEAEALNTAARAARATAGPAGRPARTLGERSYAVGDEVLVLRRIGPIAGATRGTVVALGAGTIEVQWRGRAGPGTSSVGPAHAPCLGYGYATTVPYLRSCEPERDRLLVLGDPLALSGRAAPVDAAWVTLAGPGMPATGAAGMAQRRRAGISQLATGWPDEGMLERAGPRPLNTIARRRWAEVVTACAVERDLGLAARVRPEDRASPEHQAGRPPLGHVSWSASKRRPGPMLGM